MLNGDGSVSSPGNIVPLTNNTFDLGSPSNTWSHVYVSGGSVYLDNIRLSVNNNQLLVQQMDSTGGSTVVTQVALHSVDITNGTPLVQNGGLWYNTVDGRIYVGWNDQWIDASPAIVPPVSDFLDELAVEGNVIYNTDPNNSTVVLVSDAPRFGNAYGYSFGYDASMNLHRSHLWLDGEIGRAHV